MFLKICFSILFLLSNAFAKDDGNYFSLGYGIASSSSDSTFLDGIDGSTIAATFGFKTTESFAWEIMVRKTDFDAVSASLSLLGTTFTVSNEVSSLLIGGGLRWMFLYVLNIHLGLGYSSASLNYKVTTTGTSTVPAAGAAAVADESGLGIYYGAGLQIPMGSVALLVDYTINSFAADMSSNEIVGGLRFSF